MQEGAEMSKSLASQQAGQECRATGTRTHYGFPSPPPSGKPQEIAGWVLDLDIGRSPASISASSWNLSPSRDVSS